MTELRYIFLVLFVLSLQSQAFSQVVTTPVDTAVVDSSLIVPVTIAEPAEEEPGEEERQPAFNVVPWKFHAPLGSEVTATDSTLRWQIWPDWTYKLNREPGVISYRMGTSDRSNAVQRHAHEPRHQQLFWEGINMNDPVSGTINWTVIPHQKVGRFYEQDLGTVYRSTYHHRQYYLNEPLSRLIYNESSFDKRDLEFEVSHNLSQRTNIDVSYTNMRAGGEYDNSGVTGNRILAKVSYHLDPRRYVKLNYINNSQTVNRPFGYAIADLRTFNFDHFNAVANEGSAVSSGGSNLLALSLYQRSRNSDQGPDDFRGSLYYRTNERIMEYQADSTGYSTQSIGLNGTKWLDWGPLSVEGRAGYEQFFNSDNTGSSLSVSGWGLFKSEGNVSLEVHPLMNIGGGGYFGLRSDGYQAYRLNAEADIRLGNITLTPGTSLGSEMPTPQQLYWNSEEITGSEELSGEMIQEVHGTARLRVWQDLSLGVRAQHKDITDGIMVEDSSFTNVAPYASQSATAFLEWNSSHFEFDGSATVHQFTNSFSHPNQPIPMVVEPRIWLKGSIYWKGYLLNRATYVKAGLSGMMAPFRYQADHYNPVLDSWQPLSNDQLLPVYNRLDLDISARVRSIMFVLRWENVLDDVNQLGYFETAGYPMSQRRFLIGIRALFRN